MAAVIMESCLQTAHKIDRGWIKNRYTSWALTHLVTVIYEGAKLIGTAGYDIQS